VILMALFQPHACFKLPMTSHCTRRVARSIPCDWLHITVPSCRRGESSLVAAVPTPEGHKPPGGRRIMS
jgi:hypothetical protein